MDEPLKPILVETVDDACVGVGMACLMLIADGAPAALVLRQGDDWLVSPAELAEEDE